MNTLAAKDTQHLYLWSGKNSAGREIHGEMLASSQTMLKIQLRRQDISLVQARKKFFFEDWFKAKIKPNDVTLFTRQLSTLMKAGVNIIQALDLCAKEQKNIQFQRVLTSVRMSIEGGTTFHEALAAYPLQFDRLYCNLIKAGELSGSLDQMLSRIAQYRERSLKLRRKVKRALTYPVIILAIAAIVVLIFLVYIVPAFKDLFQSAGSDLPYLTRIMVHCSEIFRGHALTIFAALFLLVSVFKLLRRHSHHFSHFVDFILLKIPLFGKLIQQFVIARFSRTLSTSYSAGLPLVDSLVSVAHTAGNQVYEKAILKLHEEVAAGQFIHVAMRQSTLFPNLAVQMISVGEESGKLDETVSKLADIYEEEVDNAADTLTQVIEPIILVVLGVIVCILVLSMYLPIFKLGTVIR